jgi:uncharacterized membrane protein YecN with MAPEG domain
MPIVLILLGLLELAGGDRRILWAAGIAFILARILPPSAWTAPRQAACGWSAWWVALWSCSGLAGWALSYAYRQPVESRNEIQIGP